MGVAGTGRAVGPPGDKAREKGESQGQSSEGRGEARDSLKEGFSPPSTPPPRHQETGRFEAQINLIAPLLRNPQWLPHRTRLNTQKKQSP